MKRTSFVLVLSLLSCLGSANSVIPRKWSIRAHIGDALVAKYSPNGRFLVSGGADKSIRIWNPDNGRLIRQVTGLADMVGDLAFSPDGSIMATISHIPENHATDTRVFIWNFPSLTPITELNGHTQNPHGIAFSPNGQFLASAGGDNKLIVWNTVNWTQVAAFSPGVTFQARPFFSTDSAKVGSVDFSGDVSLTDILTQTPVFHASPPINSFLGGSVSSPKSSIGFLHSFNIVARMNLSSGALMGQASSEIMQSYAGAFSQDMGSFIVVGLPFLTSKPEIEFWSTNLTRLSAYDTQAANSQNFPFYVDCRPGRSREFAVAMRLGEVFVAENPHVKVPFR